ncbi:uncharacterized protein LOC119731644 [Patiria miniata]|uniref:DNA-repair protein Xrcc1 N-terminal domain-containing protein n=1 Tax=Patiria miniata TaxID=46514 RepID=A0A914AAH6_PATMI|nr:uncharacterized protein LOC119731644 [Patiria miniata]
MAPVRLKEVIVFSSQDAVHRADNLLDQTSQWKRWLCAPGDRSGSMEAEFQVEKAAKIGYVDIGNYGSAFVEILVRKSSWSSNDYVTLIPATMLMSPMESRNGKNKCAVKMFTKAALNEESLKNEWDRIKVKCSQPYKKDAQFGLAFVRLRSLEEPKEQAQIVSPGPTMTKLHSKSKTTPTNKPKGRTILSPSWKTNSSFQRQFMSMKDENNKFSDAELKTRLLKMAATAETGSDKSDSLSRSAKMVLASSTNKQQTPKRQPGNHGNSAQSPADNSIKNNSDRQDKKGPMRKDNFENVHESSPPGHHTYIYHGDGTRSNENLASTTSPKPRWLQAKGREDRQPGFNATQRETEKTLNAKRPTKRPSNLPVQTSPSKVKNTFNTRLFKQVAEEFLTSFGRRLLDSKLSDIRPVLERQLGHKLSKEEKTTLKEVAMARVDVLIKDGSSSTPIQCPKPVSVANTSADSTSSSVKDVAAMEFRCCPKCYLQFTARQITGHVLSCQGIPSATGVTKATKASSSTPQRGRRGRGRGRGGGTRGRKSFSVASEDNFTTVSSHVRTAQMPSYQREGAVAKRKRGGRAANSSPRNPTLSNVMKPAPGGFLQTGDVSPPQPVTKSPQGGALTTHQYSFDSLGNSPESFGTPRWDNRIHNETSTSPMRIGCQNNTNDTGQNDEERSPCPICFQMFPVEVIEIHADMCLEQTQIFNEISNQQMACF